jgi:histidinol-phosphatase (PHP family)
MRISYHNHTRRSDGTTDLASMVAGALDAGLDEFGISDHYVCPPGGEHVCWSMPPDGLEAYVGEALALMPDAGLPMRLGVEADFFPETATEVLARLAAYPFDYILASVHLVDGFAIDADAADWACLNHAEVNHVWRAYYRRIREMAEAGFGDIVAHFDLPKKFGVLPTVDVTPEAYQALDAIAAAGMALEMNTAGWEKRIGEQYPSLAILGEARRRGIPLIIGADAHAPADVARLYPRAAAVAREAGYDRQVRHIGREREAVGLD